MPETEFLVLRLYGPLAAWGDIAVGEVRPVKTHPTKSALVGLLGASLGVKRDDSEMLNRIASSYGFAAADEGRKVRIRDFHTVQYAQDKKEKLYGYGYKMNRQRELSIPAKELKTTLTYRDYICDVVYTAAVWIKNKDSVPFSLDEIKDAIHEPVFVPYLGRKSCVLSRPMEPQIVSADNPMSAMKKAVFYGDSADRSADGKLFVYRMIYEDGNRHEDRSGQIVYEGDWNIESEITEESIRDEPLSRRTWQFGTRRVKRASFCRSDV